MQQGVSAQCAAGLLGCAPCPVEKSAEILVKMLSMQSDKRQTITPDDFRHLAKDFGVTLPEEFLYEK